MLALSLHRVMAVVVVAAIGCPSSNLLCIYSTPMLSAGGDNVASTRLGKSSVVLVTAPWSAAGDTLDVLRHVAAAIRPSAVGIAVAILSGCGSPSGLGR